MSKGPELRKAGILLFWVVMWQIADWTIDNAIVFVGPWDVALLPLGLLPGAWPTGSGCCGSFWPRLFC